MQDFVHKNATACSPNMAAHFSNSILITAVKDMRPLSVVVSREMIHAFYPGYTLPSRAHFTKMMEKIYIYEENVKAALREMKIKITVNIDTWTSISTEVYWTITCHFIDGHRELTSYSLSTMPLLLI